MNWAAPGKESMVRTTILEDTTTAKSAAQCRAREKDPKIGAAVWMWWTKELYSDDGRLGVTGVCKHRNQWQSRRSYLGTGHRGGFNAELWSIRQVIDVAIQMREIMQNHGAKTKEVLNDSQPAICPMAHLDAGPGQQLAKWIN